MGRKRGKIVKERWAEKLTEQQKGNGKLHYANTNVLINDDRREGNSEDFQTFKILLVIWSS